MKKYGVQLSGATPAVTPGEECLTAEKINGIWTMGAGYGFGLEYSPTVSSISADIICPTAEHILRFK